MAHRSETAFVGGYGSASDASADYDAVAAVQDSGASGHLEAAVVSRDPAGALTIERHARLGGVHLTHGPTDELLRIAEEVEQGSVALLVISAEDDAKAVGDAATRTTARFGHPVEHFSLADGAFAGGGVPKPAEDDAGTPVTDEQIGHLGV